MHDARDAEDNRLLEAKEHKQLLDNYVYLVEEWVSLRVRNPLAAEEIVQRVFLRLANELDAGNTYRVPYRVVVWNVVNWTCRGYEWSPKEGMSLPEGWDVSAPDAFEEWEGEHDLGVLIASLPHRDREVLDLLYREGLSPTQVAEKLGMTRNAVDQAAYRGHRGVAERLGA
jgi:DNA-directed RNA polymerase specialized sigma24 family protein